MLLDSLRIQDLVFLGWDCINAFVSWAIELFALRRQNAALQKLLAFRGWGDAV